MNKRIFNRIGLLSFILLFLLSCNQKQPHIGIWEKRENGRLLIFQFSADSTAQILDDSIPVLGGPGYLLNDGKPGICKYEIDYSKQPIWLDLVVYEKGQSFERGRIRGIVRFPSANRMEVRMTMAPNAERFKDFNNTNPQEFVEFTRR